MAKYRKKPVVIDAWEVTNDNIEELAKLSDDITAHIITDGSSECLWYAEVETLEGKMIVNRGDYLIKGVKGEYYPCKADIFEETYEEVKGDKGMEETKISIVKINANSIGDVRKPENKWIEIELKISYDKYQTSIIIKENSNCYLVDLKRRVEQILSTHLAIDEIDINRIVEDYFDNEPVKEAHQDLDFKGEM